MPALTNPKHERFAQELASGKPYHESYVIAGYKPNPSNACNLQKTNKIAQRLTELLVERERVLGQVTADAIKASGLTKAWVIEMLTLNVHRAMQAQAMMNKDGDPIGEFQYQGSVANKALELLGKEMGMFVDRSINENVNTDYVVAADPIGNVEDWEAEHSTH